jgi:hypothetical protein
VSNTARRRYAALEAHVPKVQASHRRDFTQELYATAREVEQQVEVPISAPLILTRANCQLVLAYLRANYHHFHASSPNHLTSGHYARPAFRRTDTARSDA